MYCVYNVYDRVRDVVCIVFLMFTLALVKFVQVLHRLYDIHVSVRDVRVYDIHIAGALSESTKHEVFFLFHWSKLFSIFSSIFRVTVISFSGKLLQYHRRVWWLTGADIMCFCSPLSSCFSFANIGQLIRLFRNMIWGKSSTAANSNRRKKILNFSCWKFMFVKCPVSLPFLSSLNLLWCLDVKFNAKWLVLLSLLIKSKSRYWMAHQGGIDCR